MGILFLNGSPFGKKSPLPRSGFVACEHERNDYNRTTTKKLSLLCVSDLPFTVCSSYQLTFPLNIKVRFGTLLRANLGPISLNDSPQRLEKQSTLP